ncbi:MAG: hypothetical protein ACOYK6_04035 [Chthoniobacterales bacterium]
MSNSIPIGPRLPLETTISQNSNQSTEVDNSPQKGSSENHSIAPLKSSLKLDSQLSSSQTSSQTKSVDFALMRDVYPFEGTIENITPQPRSILKSKQDPEILNKSAEVKQWAKDNAEERAAEYEEAESITASLFTDHPNLEASTVMLLKEKVVLLQDYSAKAKKYSDWANTRNFLLGGNKILAKKLENRGFSISSDWSLKEINNDFELTKQEPWAKRDPVLDEIKTLVNSQKDKEQTEKPQKPILRAPQRNYSFGSNTVDSHDNSKSDEMQDPEKYSDLAPDYARHPINRDGSPNYHIILDMHGNVMRDMTPKPPGEDDYTVS